MSNENRFKQSMAVLVSVYNNNLTPEMIQIYWQVLGGCNPDHLDRAVKAHIADSQEGKWFPKPAHLIGYIAGYVASDKNRQAIENPPARLERYKPSEAGKIRIREMIEGLKK